MDLFEIGKTYQTDKIYHGFLPYYEKWFDKIHLDVKNILEIGVLNGASLLMWRDYFPNATIYGLENGQEGKFSIPNAGERVIIHNVDQSKWSDLEKFKQSLSFQFDIIIDDGSHFHAHQQLSWEVLFPLVKSGGYYGIEDLHSMNSPVYGFPTSHPFTTFNVLNMFNSSGQIITDLISNEGKVYLEKNIDGKIDVFISKETCHLGNSITSMMRKK